MVGIDLRIKIALERNYPDKKVQGVAQKDNKLYREIRNTIKEKNIDMVDYIKYLGFDYISGWKDEITESEAIYLLDGLFPEKRIDSISSIAKKNASLYNFIFKSSKAIGMDTSEYLIKLGFKYYNGDINLNYDIDSLSKLNQKYIVNMSELARILGTKKQNLDQKIKSKKKIHKSWQEVGFTEEEIDLIINVIRSRNHYFEDESNGTIVRIYHSSHNDGKNAVLYKNVDNIKCSFELPDSIIMEMELTGFDKYEEQDMEILKVIYSDDGACEISEDEFGNKVLNVLDSKFKNKINSRLICLKLKRDEYFEKMGFKTIDRHIYTDEYIIDLLRKYIIRDNIVKIPISSKDYIKAFRIAKKRGFHGLEKFIENYGFKYERIRYMYSDIDVNERYKNIIQENYIVYRNSIYINSLDPFYNRICSFAYKKNLLPDGFIKQLGYERIKNPRDLPVDFIQFDWKTDQIRLKDVYSDDNVLLILAELSNEKYEVYLDTSSAIYWNLWKICNMRDIGINELIESLGYKRLYAWDDHKIERPHIFHEELENEKEFIDSIIIELESIQGGLEKSTTKEDKVKRSQKLVKTIKKLYHCKCQLCSCNEDGFSVPPIEKENGELYVEVHHIVPIHKVKDWEDESDKEIDNYKNVIVVCSYHHKYLHYHHGGFEKIIQDDGEYYFKSRLGDKIIIYTNHHLTMSK